MAPQYPGPAPAPQPKKRGCGFWALIAVAAVVVIAVIAAVASSGGGDSKTGDEATSPQQASVPAPAKTGGQAGGEAADVKVDECIVERTLGWPKAELTITNNSSKASNYAINVEFVDAATNVRISEGFAFASNVAPGQVVKETAQGTGDASGKTITCRVTKVDRMMAR